MATYEKRPETITADQITDEWFTGPHPNPLHPVGVKFVPNEKKVLTFSKVRGEEVSGTVGDYVVQDPDYGLTIVPKDKFEEHFRLVEV